MAEQIDKTAIRDFLGKIWAFELLSPEHLDVLAKLVKVRQFNSDEVLWLQGQEVTYFTLVYSGQLRSVRWTSSGNEKQVCLLGQGLHFGLAEMITGASSAVSLIANRPSLVLTMDRKSLRNELLSNAEICYRLMQTMARFIFSLTRELERSSFENAHTRLARLLLRRSSGVSSVGGGSQETKNVTHEKLAIQLGISRETVSRALADFKREGLIETSYRTIRVLDRDGLMGYLEDFDQW